MTKPRLLKAYCTDVWQCRSPEYWGTGLSPKSAYDNWLAYMQRHNK